MEQTFHLFIVILVWCVTFYKIMELTNLRRRSLCANNNNARTNLRIIINNYIGDSSVKKEENADGEHDQDRKYHFPGQIVVTEEEIRVGITEEATMGLSLFDFVKQQLSNYYWPKRSADDDKSIEMTQNNHKNSMTEIKPAKLIANIREVMENLTSNESKAVMYEKLFQPALESNILYSKEDIKYLVEKVNN